MMLVKGIVGLEQRLKEMDRAAKSAPVENLPPVVKSVANRGASRRWYVLDVESGEVVYSNDDPACCWQFAQGRTNSSGMEHIVVGEWRPKVGKPFKLHASA